MMISILLKDRCIRHKHTLYNAVMYKEEGLLNLVQSNPDHNMYIHHIGSIDFLMTFEHKLIKNSWLSYKHHRFSTQAG